MEHINEDPFKYIPLTFHVKDGIVDKEFLKFVDYYNSQTKQMEEDKRLKNIWIIKPGENTNRGCGINVTKDLDSIKGIVS